MNYFSKALCEIQALIKIFKENNLLKISAYSFVAFFALFLLEHFFSVYIILHNMKEIIKTIAIIGMEVSASVCISIFVVNTLEKILLKIKGKKLAQQNDIERKKLIDGLSNGEKEILKLVLSGSNSGMWVAKDNSSVLTLLYKGILEKISNEEIWADWHIESDEWDNRKICILVVISQVFVQYLKN